MPKHMPEHMPEHQQGPQPIPKARLEAFSDGVFAIIVTLLVLELRLPPLPQNPTEAQIADALIKVLPPLYAWVVSFFVTIVLWVNHHRFFALLRHSTDGLMWINAFFLLSLSFIPFPAAVVGEHLDSPLAVALFGGAIALGALMFQAMRLYATLTRGMMVGRQELKKRKFWFGLIFGPVLYTSAAALAYTNVLIAQILYVLITIYFIMPWFARPGAKTAEIEA